MDGLGRKSESVEQLRQQLTNSLRYRALDIPLPPGCAETDARLAVLFSGGIDCTVIARLVHAIVPADQSVDLINVAFENPRIKAQLGRQNDADIFELCPDRQTGRKSFAELVDVCPNRLWRFVAVS
jgi:asparagine synthetase B (glutamine-hydrolysing)